MTSPAGYSSPIASGGTISNTPAPAPAPLGVANTGTPAVPVPPVSTPESSIERALIELMQRQHEERWQYERLHGAQEVIDLSQTPAPSSPQARSMSQLQADSTVAPRNIAYDEASQPSPAPASEAETPAPAPEAQTCASSPAPEAEAETCAPSPA